MQAIKWLRVFFLQLYALLGILACKGDPVVLVFEQYFDKSIESLGVIS